MVEEHKCPSDETQGPRSLLALTALSIAVGALSGLIAALFRLLLQSAQGWRTYFILRAHDWGLLGFLWVILSIASFGQYIWQVRRHSRLAPSD